MEKMMLFNVETDMAEVVEGSIELDIQVQAHNHMTVEEFEQFQDHVNDAALIVLTAMFRGLNNHLSEEEDEDMAGWLDDVSDMQIQESADCINEALQEWLDKNDF